MRKLNKIWTKIGHKWAKFRMQPIRVFCFHQVSEKFDPDVMWEGDWISIASMQHKIGMMLSEGYRFISLQEAHHHIKRDIFRFRKYAVLTADDGDKTIYNVLPLLAERNIPLTLFVCPAFVNGEQRNGKPRPMLLKEDIENILTQYPRLITIGSHSMHHLYATSLSIEEFATEVRQAEDYLSQFANKIPYFAYPNGLHSEQVDCYLRKIEIVPVYCDGLKNYNENDVIHREIL